MLRSCSLVEARKRSHFVSTRAALICNSAPGHIHHFERQRAQLLQACELRQEAHVPVIVPGLHMECQLPGRLRCEACSMGTANSHMHRRWQQLELLREGHAAAAHGVARQHGIYHFRWLLHQHFVHCV